MQNDFPELKFILIDKLRIRLIVYKISDKQVMVSILPLALHHIFLLKANPKMLVHFYNRLADAAYSFAFVF